MNTNKMFLAGVVIAAIVVFAGMALVKKAPPPEPDLLGTPTFNFDPSLLARDYSPTKGPADAKVTLTEFMDPQCEACAAMYPVVQKIMKEFEGKVRIVYRLMAFHSDSLYAGALLLEANESGKFAQGLDLFTAKLDEWGGHGTPQPALLVDYMNQLGIDKMRAGKEFVLKKHEAQIKGDEADAEKLGVKGTPTFFVNGVMVPELGYESLKAAIEKAL